MKWIAIALVCLAGLVAAQESRAIAVAAAGDIASCSNRHDTQTGNLIERMDPRLVLTLGDNVYEHGTLWEFKNCYRPAWGSFKGRTRPSVGNHEYLASSRAAGWRTYFDRGRTFYSYRVGRWRVFALNSERRLFRQREWLRNWFERDPRKCTLAYWHKPRWSDGMHGNERRVRPLWRTFANHNGDVVLNGHDHNYQRFGLISGVREFVVGTGGGGLSRFRRSNALVRARAFGVLRLNLNRGDYTWRFRTVAGSTLDSGTGRCH